MAAAATAAATATAASAATMEGIGADVTHGRLHRVRLARRASLVRASLVRASLVGASLVAPIATAPALAATAAAAALALAGLAVGIALVVVARALAGLAAAGQAAQQAHVGLVEIDPDAALEPARQHHGAIADTDQATDGEADRVEELAHLAIAPFGDDHAIPMVRAFAAAILDALEAGALAIDLDAFEQLRARLVVERAEHAHGVLALHAEARMHQLVVQLA